MRNGQLIRIEYDNGPLDDSKGKRATVIKQVGCFVIVALEEDPTEIRGVIEEFAVPLLTADCFSH